VSSRWVKSIASAAALATVQSTWAGQAPGPVSAPDVAISARDRVYTAEQFSNAVSVTDPASNKLLGVIRLGDPTPGNLGPLYRGQLLVHGRGFSPDHRTLAIVSIGSNSVTFIDTATNSVRHVTYVGRSPHEAFFTPDGKEIWETTVRGENYVAVLDGTTFEERARITVPSGPGMQIFSPDGRYGYVCSSGDGRGLRRRSPDRRPSAAGGPLLSENRRLAGRCPGLAHAQGRWQGHGLRRAPAVHGG